MPLRSVSLIWESFIYGLGFNSQTLNGCLELFHANEITLQQDGRTLSRCNQFVNTSLLDAMHLVFS